MKWNKIVAGLSLALMMTLSIATFPIMSQAEEYTYTVKVFVGGTPEDNWIFKDAQGGELSADNKCITYKDKKPGDPITFNPQEAVELPADNIKYAVKGIKLTGDDALSSNHIIVTGDQSYVVAYEFGKLVSYTVQYLDEAGNKIIPDITFKGAEGKSLKVGIKYLDNYTGIKSADDYTDALEEGHVFKFVYTDNPNTQTIYNFVPGGTSYSTTIGNPEYTYQTVSTGQQTITDDATPLAGGTRDNRTVDTAAEEPTVEIADVDTPLAGDNNDNNDDNDKKDDSTTITDEETPLGIEDKALVNPYSRYLIILASLGAAAIIAALIGICKVESDKKKNN